MLNTGNQPHLASLRLFVRLAKELVGSGPTAYERFGDTVHVIGLDLYHTTVMQSNQIAVFQVLASRPGRSFMTRRPGDYCLRAKWTRRILIEILLSKLNPTQ